MLFFHYMDKYYPAGLDKEYLKSQLFTTLVCREDTLTHKPSLELYLTAIKRLGCTSEVSIAIEDSPFGIHSAISAGLKCIVVGCSLTKEMNLSHATMQFSSLVDFNLRLLSR